MFDEQLLSESEEHESNMYPNDLDQEPESIAPGITVIGDQVYSLWSSCNMTEK